MTEPAAREIRDEAGGAVHKRTSPSATTLTAEQEVERQRLLALAREQASTADQRRRERAARASRDLPVGTRVRYKPTGDVVTLARRKKPHESRSLPGWWIEPTYGAGGLADVVIDEAENWEVIDG